MKATLGVVLAGGGSRRFGSPKAGAELQGRSLMDHALDRLEAAGVAKVGIVASHTGSVPGWEPVRSVEVRRDGAPDLGPLEGLRVALAWARELDLAGVLVLPVDLPLVSPGLLRHLVAERAPGWQAVVPQSDGPRGYEPLCAWYSADLLEAVNTAMAEGAHAPAHLLERVSCHRVPLAVVARFGDPEIQFLNVNRPDALERAREMADSVAADGVSPQPTQPRSAG